MRHKKVERGFLFLLFFRFLFLTRNSAEAKRLQWYSVLNLRKAHVIVGSDITLTFSCIFVQSLGKCAGGFPSLFNSLRCWSETRAEMEKRKARGGAEKKLNLITLLWWGFWIWDSTILAIVLCLDFEMIVIVLFYSLVQRINQEIIGTFASAADSSSLYDTTWLKFSLSLTRRPDSLWGIFFKFLGFFLQFCLQT